jgi:hypothetical protein
MYLRLASVLALLVAGIAASGAGEYRNYKSSRGYVKAAPIKDCTPFNGRWGYYGNPWCTPREQAAWDRWSANRQWWR